MVNESILRLSFLIASFFVVSLSASWYRRDPLSPRPLAVNLPLSLLIDLGVSQLDAIPTVRFSDPILSYLSTLRFNLDGLPRLKYGYEEASASIFKNKNKMVAFSCPELMLRSGSQTSRGLFKIAIFRRWMVLALGSEPIEDVRKTPDDVLSLNASPAEPDYTLSLLDLNNEYLATGAIRPKLARNIAVTFKEVREELIRSLDASISVHGDAIISLLPKFLKSNVLQTLPFSQNSFARMEEFGEGLRRQTGIYERILSNPEYVEPRRREVGTAVAEEVWTKAGMHEMHEIDSFVRESQMSLVCVALRTFTNRVTVPAARGTLVAISSAVVYMDGEIDSNPDEYDGFCFAKFHEYDRVGVAGYKSTSASMEYFTFGYGRHARFEEGKQTSRSLIVNAVLIPGKANAMFKERQK
ncbi:hypothetical protein EDB87DRAFT_1573341 [Lactarius vividus]|nr:hypothetical protein EDB87DRAFT_1573341 [Lactarius vividus]